MPCNYPLRGWRTHGGKITTRRAGAFRDLPPIDLACGRCTGCRIQRAADLTTRALHEAAITEQTEGRSSSFLTLTYDDNNLPTDYGLQRDDLTKFLKRLRKAMGSFRYLACGEYGDTTRRPHYHALLFGLSFREDRIQIEFNGTSEQPSYLSPALSRLWKLGQHVVKDLTPENCAYVARYVMKKRTGDRAAETYRRTTDHHQWQVAPEFSAMSLRPGLGARWWERYRDDIRPGDELVLNGKRVHTPRYYDTLLERSDPARLAAIKKERKRNIRKETHESREARDLITERRAKQRNN